MYKENYVVAVRQGNQTLKEEGGKVAIPFGEEYQLRLRNKRGQDSVAFIYIDGRVVVKDGLVVPGHGYVDLERFVEDDMNKGNRFKFVPLADSRVEDKGEPDNGIIEVRFHEARDKQYPIFGGYKEIHYHHHDYHHHRYCDCWHCRRWHYPGTTWCASPIYGAVQTSCNSSAVGCVSSSGSLLREATLSGKALSDAGATVEGSTSHQAFSHTVLDYDKGNFVSLSLKLVGIPGGKFCPSCGSKATGRYCSACGTALE